MRLSVTIPDDHLGEGVKRRAENVSGFITEAVEERLHEIRRREALDRLAAAFEQAQGHVDPGVHEANQGWRRESDRLLESEDGET